MATHPVPAQPAPRGDSKLLLLILAIGLQVALLGAYIGSKTVFGNDAGAQGLGIAATPPPPNGGFGVGSDVHTSFGSIVVGTAQGLPGLPAKALGGMNHGIAGYVSPNEAQVQVTVVITNRTREPVPYSPSQFTVRSATTAPVKVTASSIKPATLLPDAAVEATLVFVVPRKNQKLSLAFQDRGRSTPFLVDISHIDTAPPAPGTEVHH